MGLHRATTSISSAQHCYLLAWTVSDQSCALAPAVLCAVQNDWKHPPILNFDPPIEITNGQGLKLIATYDNPTDYTVRFGFASTDEMMILFGWYYK